MYAHIKTGRGCRPVFQNCYFCWGSDVHNNLAEMFLARLVGERVGEFLEWEQTQPAPPPQPHNRVEFVPRVDENPFGVADDFEERWL